MSPLPNGYYCYVNSIDNFFHLKSVTTETYSDCYSYAHMFGTAVAIPHHNNTNII